MPELPEVETAKRFVARQLGSGPIREFSLTDPAVVRTGLSTRPSDQHPEAARVAASWVGRRVIDWRRHGKRIGWRLDGPVSLVSHLGMTGRFEATHSGAALRCSIVADGGVAYVDERRFGCFAPVATDALEATLRDGHGPDALDEPMSGPALRTALRGSRAVKVALLDQAVLAGLGNIHAVEVLWRCGVHPRTRCDALGAAAARALADEIPAQLARFVEDRPTAYVNQGGDNPFAVYGREGQPCPRCGGPITRLVDGGRGTFLCEGCQPPPRAR